MIMSSKWSYYHACRMHNNYKRWASLYKSIKVCYCLQCPTPTTTNCYMVYEGLPQPDLFKCRSGQVFLIHIAGPGWMLVRLASCVRFSSPCSWNTERTEELGLPALQYNWKQSFVFSSMEVLRTLPVPVHDQRAAFPCLLRCKSFVIQPQNFLNVHLGTLLRFLENREKLGKHRISLQRYHDTISANENCDNAKGCKETQCLTVV